MTAMWGLRMTFTLCLTLLLLCYSAWALECYNCKYTSDPCKDKATCASPDDSCLVVHNSQTNTSLYRCYQMNKCSSEMIAKDLVLEKFTSRCCQKDNCNSGGTSLPIATTTMVFSLVAAVVMICYP